MVDLADCLLVIDLQNGVCKGKQPVANFKQLIEQVNARIEIYKANKRPIIFVQHNDTTLLAPQYAWQLVPELSVPADAQFVQKTHANSFWQTNMQVLLEQKQIHSLEICGAQTEYCVDTTVKVAHSLGYQLQMVSGLSTTVANSLMIATQTIAFYEDIWADRFLTLIEG
ncbi:cysteine hydrolase [Latilactobacillus sakei]|uniref:cysteine hydrolase family protein n=1 Tax=Latilactobacillus sakei TaxID=1599 RepID=UPI000B9D705A|nr:cysteine hydrolase family protein [Latilactobacillus sakei]USG07223.1 cysteine hydrolase [Latilactobacillus sakei]USG10898.1 cysteine hydrolase [Latilactobacillus sakei]BAX69207.1 isochorismatase/nicotamidase hydrolase [Latilactobacillus sakei]SON70442.1 putative hydrolase, isochorismatase/nicotamidase family [Latilactobacillus sakei]